MSLYDELVKLKKFVDQTQFDSKPLFIDLRNRLSIYDPYNAVTPEKTDKNKLAEIKKLLSSSEETAVHPELARMLSITVPEKIQEKKEVPFFTRDVQHLLKLQKMHDLQNNLISLNTFLHSSEFDKYPLFVALKKVVETYRLENANLPDELMERDLNKVRELLNGPEASDIIMRTFIHSQPIFQSFVSPSLEIKASSVSAASAPTDLKTAEEYYQEGLQLQGSATTKAEARLAFQKAVDKNHVKALNNLGIMMIRGEGGPKDAKKAHDYFLKGAQAGYGRAMLCLASQLEHGDGITQDLPAALNWYNEAIKLNDPVTLGNAKNGSDRVQALIPSAPKPRS